MNLRKITLRYMGWCPGVHSVAMWIPDKEYSNRRVFASSMTVFMVIIGVSLFYRSSLKPSSYSWDIEFTEAAYDDAMDMYVVEKRVNLDGDYNISIWTDSAAGESCFIRWLYLGPVRDQLHQEWIITDGVIRCFLDEYGLHYSEPRSARASTVWMIYSNSRDQKVHIRIQYLGEYPVWQPP
jgi:hypothetical protein